MLDLGQFGLFIFDWLFCGKVGLEVLMFVCIVIVVKVCFGFVVQLILIGQFEDYLIDRCIGIGVVYGCVCGFGDFDVQID